MTLSRVPTKEILRQVRVAKVLEDRDRREGRRATSARYDQRTGMVILELSTGYLFGFPAASIPQLAGASNEQLATVEASPGGYGLHWERLDVDLSVPGLLMSTIGHSWKLSELARVAGQTKSPAKAAAARRNGSKGGRPRKKATRNRR
jgi:hypothetical protein